MKSDNFYDDETDTMTAEKPDKMDGDKETPVDETESPVEVVSKSFFMGKTPKPGDTCEVKVTRTDGDSVLIEYVRDMSREGEEENATEEPEMAEKEGEGLYD